MSDTNQEILANFSRIKFYCDTNRCIECHGCDVACKEAHHLPVGVNRRRVVVLNEGQVGKESAVSVACMHCADAPCAQVCPVDCFYIRADGIVLHDKKTCIGCGYCLYACPFGAPQFPKNGVFESRGAMDKCTFCAGGPEETNRSTSTARLPASICSASPTPVSVSSPPTRESTALTTSPARRSAS